MNSNLLEYQEDGNGEVVVFIHGFCEDKTLWNSFSKALSADYRVICIDLPGFGGSEIYEGFPSTEGYAKEVHHLLIHLKIDYCVVIGHSLGGYVTLAFAEQYPHLLKGFCLFHSTAFADTDDKITNRNKTIDFVEQQGTETFVKALMPKLFTENNRKIFANEIQLLITRASTILPQAIIDATIAMRDRKDRIAILKNSSFPILFIAGIDDTTVPVAVSKQQSDLPSKPHSCYLLNTAHMGMIEQKEQTISELSNFLKVCFLNN